MVSFPYHGGVYEGHIKMVKNKPNGKKKARARKYKMIPHGRGIYKFNGMVFNGIFNPSAQSDSAGTTILWATRLLIVTL